eukprot:scaffold7456_cov159-Ochromonas_danica.AAC.3
MVKQSSHTIKSKVQKKATKAKYPNFRSSLIVPTSSHRKQCSHSVNLKELISMLCENEMKGLDEWLKSNDALRKTLTDQGIVESIQNVLRTLPKEIDVNTPQDIHFYPEISLAERAEVKRLSGQLKQLEELKKSIVQFNQDLKSITEEESASSEAQVVVSTDVKEALDNYKEILTRMDNSCDAMLALADDTNDQLFQARKVQDQLYDECNE